MGREDPPPGARVAVSPNPRCFSRMVRLRPRFVILKSPVIVRKSRFFETVARKSGYGWELCDRLPWGGPDAGRVRVAQRREVGHLVQTGATPDPRVPAAPGRVLRPGHPGAGGPAPPGRQATVAKNRADRGPAPPPRHP